MALTPAEEQELLQLEQREQQLAAQFAQQPRQGLTTEEITELAELESREASLASQQELGSQAQTAIESFGQAATLGFLPQIQAGAEALIEKFTPESEADRLLREQGFTLPEEKGFEEQFIERRDINIERQRRQAEISPKSALAGTIAGALTTGIATGG